MARGQAHDPETKAKVLAALATGQTPSSVARDFGISRTTVSMWRDAAGLNPSAAVVRGKVNEIGEQLFENLAESIETQTALLLFVRDEQYLKRQSAHDLAILFGVLADKSFRMLASLQQSNEKEQVSDIQDIYNDEV